MENKQPLVSVIIPVYKTEKYLEKCVRSVMDQTYRNLEIILVDDGSPDGCPKMCDRFADEDERVTVIHKENGGVAMARNDGLKVAAGDYLFFVDSDDIVFSDTIGIMVNAALKNDLDMVCAGCVSIDENEIFEDTISEDMKMKIISRDSAMKYYAAKEWAPWNRLIRSDVHIDIFFPNYCIHEDEAIKFKLIWRCGRIAEINAATYCYRQRTGSITSDECGINKIDMFYASMDNYKWLQENCPRCIKYFIGSLWRDVLYNVGKMCGSKDICSEEFRDMLKFARTHFLEIICGKKITPQERFRALLFVISGWNSTDNVYCCFYRAIGRMK